MRARRTSRTTRGFTLLEVGVALAILGVGLVSCLQIFSSSLRLQDSSTRRSRCILQARAAMDALLYVPELTDHTEERPTAEGCLTRILVRHAGAEEGLSEQDLDLQSDMSLRYLQVDVTWQDGTGAKSYTLRSLRAAPEDA